MRDDVIVANENLLKKRALYEDLPENMSKDLKLMLALEVCSLNSLRNFREAKNNQKQ